MSRSGVYSIHFKIIQWIRFLWWHVDRCCSSSFSSRLKKVIGIECFEIWRSSRLFCWWASHLQSLSGLYPHCSFLIRLWLALDWGFVDPPSLLLQSSRSGLVVFLFGRWGRESHVMWHPGGPSPQRFFSIIFSRSITYFFWYFVTGSRLEMCEFYFDLKSI